MLATASPQYDVERAQAVVRLVIAPIAIGYTLVMHLRSAIDPTLAGWILLLESLFLAASLALWNDIRRRPGNHPVRRVLTMLSDYTCITLTLSLIHI